jgi:stearoyl-CoA desaturase (delta-9 desaturase)
MLTQNTSSPPATARLVPDDPADLESPLSYSALAAFVILHAAALTLAVPFFSWKAMRLAVWLHIAFGGSVTLGVHRYFSHHTFKAPRWLQFVLALAYTLSFDRCGQGIISWAAAHKFHHAYADKELDPHSPIHGFWHSFCGHHLYRRRDLWDFQKYKRYCPELSADPMLVWFDRPRNIWALQLLFAVSLFLLGGLRGTRQPFDYHMASSFVVWGICVRFCFTQTLHSLLDTLNHGAGPFGLLPDTYKTRTNSKNNFLMWLLQLGNETWHNVHHAFPRAANNGGRWYRWDMDSLIMKALESIGVISGCKWIDETDLARRRGHQPTRQSRPEAVSLDHDTLRHLSSEEI